MEEMKSILRNNLRGYRVKAGLTQINVAHELGVSQSTIKYWEREPQKLPFDKLAVLSQLYNVKVTDFFAEI